MRRSKHLIAAAVAVAAAAGVAATAGQAAVATPGAGAATDCPLPRFGPGRDYHPAIDPEDFSAHVTNPLLPLVPGRTLVYTGVKDGKAALDIVAATAQTRIIDGVRTRVVQDRLYLDGVLEERTADYFAQDECGNVWYFGEDTATLDAHGHVTSTEGSFHAGVDGAQPGVFMQATPEVGRKFRQEWYEGHAEDQFAVLRLATTVTVPAGRFTDALLTAEKTRLEPDVLDNKYYVRGIGEVEEVAVKGDPEKLVLVEVIS